MSMLKIALPSGSLEEPTLNLFKAAGLEVIRSPRCQEAAIKDPRISEVVIMSPQLIPQLVEEGKYDLGICGLDWVAETKSNVARVAELGYSQFTDRRARVVLFGSVNDPITQASEVEPGSKILSEYPYCTRSFFDRLGINVRINFSYKTTEANIPRDYKYGVCVSERGESLAANNLKIIEILFDATTTLIASEQAMRNYKKEAAIHILKLLLVGTLEGQRKVFLIMNVPADKIGSIIKKLPAMKKPTVSKLWTAGEKYFSVSAVVERSEANLIIPDLLEAGAEDLVEQPVSKVVQHW